VSELFWLSQAQFERIKRHLPPARGVPRIDDFRVISGIIHVIRNGLLWKDAPVEYGRYKTLYHRFIKWSRAGIFNHIFAELAVDGITVDWLTSETWGFTVQRTALRLVKKGMLPAVSAAQGSDLSSEDVARPKHYTTIVLESELRDALEEIALTEGYSVHGLCNAVYDLKKPSYSFGASLRVFIVEYYRSKANSVMNNNVSQVLDRIKSRLSSDNGI
jgi:putative transposase